MASFKTHQKSLNPISLWTFDGDKYDPINRMIIVPEGQSEEIQDEMNFVNNAILIDNSDINTGIGYRLGAESLVKLETTDVKSMCFGINGYCTNFPDHFPVTRLEIPHSISYNFPNRGSFCCEFLVNKHSESTARGYLVGAVTRTFIRKYGVFHFYYYESSSVSYFKYDYHSGSIQIPTTFNGRNLIGKPLYIVFGWEVIETGIDHYKGIARVYINGMLINKVEYEFLDGYPTTNLSTPIEIAGINGGTILTDRQTSPCYLDNIAIYDRMLTEIEISKAYSKIYSYEDMLINNFVDILWLFNDFEILNDYYIKPHYKYNLNSSYNALSQGTDIQRERAGPDNIPGSSSTLYTNNSFASFTFESGSYYYTPFNLSSDFTLEFALKTSQSTFGTILCFRGVIHPFIGLCLELNKKNGIYKKGAICLRRSIEEPYLNSLDYDDDGYEFSFPNDKWNWVTIVQKSNNLSLWINDKKHDTKSCIVRPVKANQGFCNLLNSIDGVSPVIGDLYGLAFYSHALPDNMIKIRCNYQIIYRFRGVITLQGIPCRALLRIYRSSTGELLTSVYSDQNTGEYEVSLIDDGFVDVVVSNYQNTSIRMRVFGPIRPGEYDDLPIQI